VVAYLLAIRPSDQLLAMQGWALACWAMMRHVSFVIEARRGASTRLADYRCYLLFFPSCFGAMETYDEFAARNLERRRRPDLGAGLVGAIRGDVLVRAGLVVPITQDAWLAGTGFAELWGLSLLWFLRGALFLGGVWSMIEADALLLGMRLRPNFTGILTAQNPSRFWRAWRGTMTHWLIRHVYIPLGGNQRYRTRNIFAAFAVSTVWHLAASCSSSSRRPPAWSSSPS
jgi:MBOAT, membrane-bound O-acyltransferase family